MTLFDERKDAFGRRFAPDEALQAPARRTHHPGLWTAGELGQGTGAAGAYAEALVPLEVGRGSEAMVRTVPDDLGAAGCLQSEPEMRQSMTSWLAEAERQLRFG